MADDPCSGYVGQTPEQSERSARESTDRDLEELQVLNHLLVDVG